MTVMTVLAKCFHSLWQCLDRTQRSNSQQTISDHQFPVSAWCMTSIFWISRGLFTGVIRTYTTSTKSPEPQQTYFKTSVNQIQSSSGPALPNCHAPLIDRRFACNVDGASNLCLDMLEVSRCCLELALLCITQGPQGYFVSICFETTSESKWKRRPTHSTTAEQL